MTAKFIANGREVAIQVADAFVAAQVAKMTLDTYSLETIVVEYTHNNEETVIMLTIRSNGREEWTIK